MAQMKELLPKGEYTIKNVGPSRNWEYNGTSMVTYSVQLEGHEQYWVDLNQKSDTAAPSIGDKVNGHVEQDTDGKYAPKFKKENSGGGNWGGRGGGAAAPGAIWSAAFATAAQIVSGFYLASGKKPASIQEYFGKVELIAPKVNSAVDKLVASNAKTEAKPADTTSSEAGESPAPAAAAPKADVVVEDITDEDLGEW